MEGYQLPSFDTSVPLKPQTSTPSQSFRGLESFAFLNHAPPQDVLTPPSSVPKIEEPPAYNSPQPLNLNAELQRTYVPSSATEQQAKAPEARSIPSQPPVYHQSPFRPPESSLYLDQRIQQAPSQAAAPLHQHPQAQPVQSPPSYGYHAEKDPVKALIEAYPNPQTEYEKLRQTLENMNSQLLAHFKKMELFAENVDQRLTSLESTMKDLSGSKSKGSASLYPGSKEASKSSSYKYKTSPKNKKKKKTRTISAYEADSKGIPAPSISVADGGKAESDEELAKRLQRQFNLEAAEPATPSDVSTAVSDEEYARRLQSLYLKRDMQRAKRKSVTPSTATDKKEAAEDKKKPEDKPSLWSRLFGGTTEENQAEDDENELQPIPPKVPPATPTKPATYSPVPASAPLQPLPMPAPYGFYPQQPYMLGQGMPQYASYVPMQTPTGPQYVLQPHTSSN